MINEAGTLLSRVVWSPGAADVDDSRWLRMLWRLTFVLTDKCLRCHQGRQNRSDSQNNGANYGKRNKVSQSDSMAGQHSSFSPLHHLD